MLKYSLKFVAVIAILFFVYILIFFIVFNLSEYAYIYDVEYDFKTHERLIAGPRPRSIFCQTEDGANYNGGELIFKVYKPFCYIYTKMNKDVKHIDFANYDDR